MRVDKIDITLKGIKIFKTILKLEVEQEKTFKLSSRLLVNVSMRIYRYNKDKRNEKKFEYSEHHKEVLTVKRVS